MFFLSSFCLYSSYELAANIEARWKQRSRCLWLSQGDQNSRYFHAIASSRLRRNLVINLEHNGCAITDQQGILVQFVNAMQQILGSSDQVMLFDAAAFYNQNPELHQLQHPFTMHEIAMAVQQLANCKASGPDGLPNEFVKIY